MLLLPCPFYKVFFLVQNSGSKMLKIGPSESIVGIVIQQLQIMLNSFRTVNSAPFKQYRSLEKRCSSFYEKRCSFFVCCLRRGFGEKITVTLQQIASSLGMGELVLRELLKIPFQACSCPTFLTSFLIKHFIQMRLQ